MAELFISVSAAARKHGLTQLQVWQLIRQKKLRSRIDGMRQVEVDAAQLDRYVKAHPEQIEAWRQPKRPETTDVKPQKSFSNYGKF